MATATSLFFPLLICSTHLINLVSFNQQTAQQDHLKQLFSSRQPNQSRVSGRAVMKGLMTLMTLLSLPVSLKMPMALNVYWFSSALFSLAQTRILQSSRFLKYLRRWAALFGLIHSDVMIGGWHRDREGRGVCRLGVSADPCADGSAQVWEESRWG